MFTAHNIGLWPCSQPKIQVCGLVHSPRYRSVALSHALTPNTCKIMFNRIIMVVKVMMIVVVGTVVMVVVDVTVVLLLIMILMTIMMKMNPSAF